MTNPSFENYLKAIYELSYSGNQGVSTNSLAKRMGVKAASVTQMIQKLASHDLISYRKYMGVQLSDSGRKIAIKTIRKHRLWEVFLFQKLKFKWDEVKVLAEELEHIGSDNMANKLESFLNFPKEDPMGLPIPDEYGEVKTKSTGISIYELREHDRAVVSGVKDQSSPFLKFLSTMGLTIGVPIIFKNKVEYDESVNIVLGLKEISLSKKVAKNLILRKSETSGSWSGR